MSERKKHFLIRLRSQGLCFICLRDKREACKSQVNGGQLLSTSSTPTTFRLRSIVRFLGIDTEEILKSHLSPDLSKCGDVKVELCGECSELVAKVNSLYQTMEVTRIKLEDCVRRMHHLIGEAERDDERVEEVKQRVSNVTAAGVLKGLRKGMYEKCSRRLERALPRVVLDCIRPANVSKVIANPRRAEEVQVKVEAVEHEEDPAMPVLVPIDGYPSCNQFPKPGRAKVLRRPKNLNHPSDSLQGKCLRSSRSRLKGPGGGSKFHCDYCKGFRRSGNHMRIHMVKLHCHHYFKDHKSKAISDVVFERLVAHLLFKDLLLSVKNRCQCSVCPRSFLFTRQNRFAILKLHLIEEHYDVLLSKLMKLQRDPDLERKLEECPSRRKARSLEKSLFQISKPSCPHCKIVIPTDNGWNLPLHFANYHLEKLFEPEEKFKATFLSSLQFKQVLHHLLFQGFSLGSASKCPCCSKNFTNRTNHELQLKMHMIKHHRSFLEQRLQELQADPELNQKLSLTPLGHVCRCGAYFESVLRLRRHETRFCNLLDAGGEGFRKGHSNISSASEMKTIFAGVNGGGPFVKGEGNQSPEPEVQVGEEVCTFPQFEEHNENEMDCMMEEEYKIVSV